MAEHRAGYQAAKAVTGNRQRAKRVVSVGTIQYVDLDKLEEKSIEWWNQNLADGETLDYKDYEEIASHLALANMMSGDFPYHMVGKLEIDTICTKITVSD